MRATLIEARLQEAVLVGTNLLEANLLRADLRDAELNGTLLAGTNLSGANVEGANFSQAVLSDTILASIDLRMARNLELAGHLAPSPIGIDTLYLSQGNIPSIFLRGCGVPDELITYIQSFLEQTITFYSCFVSYSHADKVFATRLHDTLQARGIRCWLDEKQLLPGDDIYEHVDRGIRLWDKVLLCCSEASLTSWWVDNEIAIAFSKEQQLMKERGQRVLALVPLNLDGYLLSGTWKGGKATQVNQRLAADFTGWEKAAGKFDREIENVIRALRADDGAREQAPPPRL